MILIDEFSEYFDGFSIGSNDLTQLTLGIDRDNYNLSSEFNEYDPGMLKFYKLAIQGSHLNNKFISICGEAPSENFNLVKFLYNHHIDCISLSSSSFMKTCLMISKLENEENIENENEINEIGNENVNGNANA